jgi:hypothetical protein
MDLSKAISDCIKALHLQLITECIFVYNCHLSKSIGKWNNQRIQSLCRSNVPEEIKEQIVLSEPNLVSGLKEERVNHPSFGFIGRVGWAKMKGGEEWGFRITRKVIVT